MSEQKMSRSERQELGQIIRKRERVLKAMSEEQAAKMMADFDRQLAEIYSYDQDKVWKAAAEEAGKVVAEANEKIAARCKKLGIPPEFAPSLAISWMGRGQNATAGRRVELRRMAASRVKAIQAEAERRIERMSLTAQTEIIAHGLESAAAKQFLDEMPKLEELMPAIDANEIKQLHDQQTERQRKGIWE